MKILQRNLYPILLVLFLVWMAIGVFPLYCYENDSMHVLTSCGIVVNQGIQFPPMLHYEYDMQPLTYFVVVIVAKIASFLTVEHVYCLLAWISAVAFSFGVVARDVCCRHVSQFCHSCSGLVCGGVVFYLESQIYSRIVADGYRTPVPC